VKNGCFRGFWGVKMVFFDRKMGVKMGVFDRKMMFFFGNFDGEMVFFDRKMVFLRKF
jgi:hypothetical protein